MEGDERAGPGSTGSGDEGPSSSQNDSGPSSAFPMDHFRKALPKNRYQFWETQPVVQFRDGEAPVRSRWRDRGPFCGALPRFTGRRARRAMAMAMAMAVALGR